VLGALAARERGGVIADVCLVLEGSYPYVRGGVSEWAHLLIKGLPERTFHLWCVVADDTPTQLRYELPTNVVGVTNTSLFRAAPGTQAAAAARIPETLWEAVRWFHRDGASFEDRARALWDGVLPALDRFGGSLPVEELLLGEEAYRHVVALHDARAPQESFIDYFYTFLYTHFPLLRLLVEPAPPARAYHAIATGYAGLLAACARRRTGRPMLLTEHGIYTNERQIEIILAKWIWSPPQARIRIGPDQGRLKRIWMALFDFLGRLTYREADVITTLFEGNARMQLERGADPSKLEIVPNGVDLARFTARVEARDPERPVVGLVGRVVAIKDIRTFMRACRAVADRVPGARFLVMGPCDEGDSYFKKCLDYRRLLGLEDRLEFTGPVDVARYYPQLDVVALTSVSEGLPLTVLEAMASGVPVVCTRVGACEELVNGRTMADRRLGAAGFTADVGDHVRIGDAIVRLLADPALARRCGEAGRRRVERFYELGDVMGRYGELYARYLEVQRWPASACRSSA
jgi:glycosyltransferase involved in cell wall biosynthesis